MDKLRMGIMGPGGIANAMAQTVTKMEDVELYAVASRNRERALEFAGRYGAQKAYGSYEELAEDEMVDLVYVATPHSEHLANASLCIMHGKAVLCEKSFTANAAQAKELIELAAREKVLVAEAMWVRYMPMLSTIREVMDSGIIGRPSMLTANLGYKIDQVKRLQDPALAGGALLDVGVYPINFAFMIFGSGGIGKVSSSCTYTASGLDEQNSVTIQYEDGRVAVINSSMLSISDRKGIIYGSEGFMVIENINNFESITVFDNQYREIKRIDRPGQITGYEYEVEACRRALLEGKLECEEMPHAETLKVMEFMDGLRREWGIRFPFEG